jgi:hypothetical protein
LRATERSFEKAIEPPANRLARRLRPDQRLLAVRRVEVAAKGACDRHEAEVPTEVAPATPDLHVCPRPLGQPLRRRPDVVVRPVVVRDAQPRLLEQVCVVEQPAPCHERLVRERPDLAVDDLERLHGLRKEHVHVVLVAPDVRIELRQHALRRPESEKRFVVGLEEHDIADGVRAEQHPQLHQILVARLELDLDVRELLLEHGAARRHGVLRLPCLPHQP